MPGSKQHQRLEIEVDETFLSVVSNPHFLLYPRLTLSVDANELGQCGICHDSQLLLRSQETVHDDQTVAILPCGHIAGYECLRNWLDFNKTCPFCRISLEYELCKHSSRLIWPLTKENLYSVPDPIPSGGKIREQCFDCSVETNRKVNQQLLDGFVGKFKKLRAEYQAATSQHVKLVIKQRIVGVKLRMESTMQELAAPSSTSRDTW